MRIRVRNPLRAIVAIALTAAMAVGSMVARADTREELDAAEARLEELRATRDPRHLDPRLLRPMRRDSASRSWRAFASCDVSPATRSRWERWAVR